MEDFVRALAMLFILEGILYGIFTDYSRTALDMIRGLPKEFLQQAGLISVLLGCAMLWLVRAM